MQHTELCASCEPAHNAIGSVRDIACLCPCHKVQHTEHCPKCAERDGFQDALGCSNRDCPCHNGQHTEESSWERDFEARHNFDFSDPNRFNSCDECSGFSNVEQVKGFIRETLEAQKKELAGRIEIKRKMLGQIPGLTEGKDWQEGYNNALDDILSIFTCECPQECEFKIKP